MDKKDTIFEELPQNEDGSYAERLVNPDGSGLEGHLFVSACETPEQQVFWVVAQLHKARPDHSGLAADFKTAEQEVLAQLDGKRALCRHAQLALDEFVEQKIEQVMNSAEGEAYSETARLEFIYEKYGFIKYQIKSKTAQDIEVYGFPYTEKFKPDEKVPTFKLNKRQLDNKGEATARGQLFCTEARKMEIEKFKKAPRYLQVFGLDWNATIGDVKYWFRKLSKQHHPDRGGDVKKFRELIESYEKAVNALIDRDRRDGLIV